MTVNEITVKVTLNGTNTNPYAKWGLTGNPFPTIPRAEAAGANEVLRKLDAGPLQSTDDIRSIMKGCDDELVELCCSQFKPGERVSFNITFPDVWR